MNVADPSIEQGILNTSIVLQRFILVIADPTNDILPYQNNLY